MTQPKPANKFRLRIKLFLAGLSILLIEGISHASDDTASRLTVVDDRSMGNFYVGGEASSLHSSSDTLTGYGLLVGYNYILSGRWALDATLSQIYGTGQGLTALYTGISASARWAPFREFFQGKSALIYEGQRVFEEVSANDGVVGIGLQMNQLFLNGNSSVYNATGLGAILTYDTRVWGRSVRPDLRYAIMTANEEALTGIFIDLSVPF